MFSKFFAKVRAVANAVIAVAKFVLYLCDQVETTANEAAVRFKTA